MAQDRRLSGAASLSPGGKPPESRFRAFIEEVRTASNIVDVVGQDVSLHPAGSTLAGLSPFTAEERPSFVVWPETQSWHDFSGGGGPGGDVFAYVQEREKCGFKEAIYLLAERAGIKRPNQDEEQYRREMSLLVERRDVERVLSHAAAYYHNALPDKVRGEWYRERYAFEDETTNGLLLGWANGHLYDYITEHLGVTRELALKTGLFIAIGSNRVEDFFRNRLVFPYWKAGRVVYFIARATQYVDDTEWEKAKYKKLLTHSQRHSYVSPTVGNDYFYNEDAVRGADQLLVTEGVTDCISAYQAGIPCISPVTTRFRTRDVPKLTSLTRWAKQVLICNDAEESGAGEAGAVETAAALIREGRDVRVATLPRPDGVEKIDLNEFLKANETQVLRDLLASAPRYPRFLIERIPEDISKSDLQSQLASLIQLVVGSPPLVRDEYLDIIVERFRIKRRTLQAIVREAVPKDSDDANTDTVSIALENERRDLIRIRGEVHEDVDHYYTIGRDGIEVISSFTIEPKARYVHEDGETIVGEIHTKDGVVARNATFPPTAWHSKRDFIRALKQPELQWTGSDDNVQGVLRILAAREVQRREATGQLGYIDSTAGPRWVAPDIVIGPDGICDDDSVVYAALDSPMASRLRYPNTSPEKLRAIAQKALPTLLQINVPEVLLPVLGWFFATPFRPRIVDILGHFPILVVWGTQGSGKTSIVKYIFWPLFGAGRNTEPFSATDTEFAMIRLLSSTKSIPVFIDEYKPRDMPQFRVDRLHRLLRRIYGGEIEQRGRPDLTLSSYTLSAPVCLAGESRPDGDAALMERIISVSPSKNSLQSKPELSAAFDSARRLDLNALSTPYIQFALGRDTRMDLERSAEAAQALFEQVSGGSDLPSRCQDNIHVMIFGLTMFEAFAESLGVTLPELDIIPALDAYVRGFAEGDRGAKDPFDLFLEALSAYASMGVVEEGTHYALVNGLLCLHMSSCYQVYLTERRRAGLDDDTNGRAALRRVIREKLERGSYIVEIDKRVTMKDRFVRTVAVQLEDVPDSLEVEEFPVTRERTWGGNRGGWEQSDD